MAVIIEGVAQMTANLGKLSRAGQAASLAALEDMARETLRLSEMEVPLDEGRLANSGAVEPEPGGFMVGYHTPYAARLHEHPEYNFQNGRKGKYLEDPIKHNLKTFALYYKQKVTSANV